MITKTKVLIVDGYGSTIGVERGHLIVKDGFATSGDLRQIHFPRGRCEIDRIIVRARAGSVSLDAVDWCNQMGIPIAFVGSDSRLINTLVPPGPSDAPLKRAQGYAALCDDGVTICQEMLREKFTAQLRALEHDFPSLGILVRSGSRVKTTVAQIFRAIDDLGSDKNLRSLLVREGYVARLYWSVLLDSPLPWPEWTPSRIPAHWLAISSRDLGATQVVRDATDPFNAILNYAYALAEVETRIAIHATGLDPDLGLLHVDRRARESLVCDLIEPLRSFVDYLCLQFCKREGLRPHMFHELRDGIVRLDPDAARDLAAWIMPKVRRPANQVAARFTARLRRLTVPYRLEIKAGTDRRLRGAPTELGPCGHCGRALDRAGRKYCSRQCTLQHLNDTQAPWKAAQAKLAMLRAQHSDPGHGGEAAKKRGSKVAESNRRRTRFHTEEQKRIASNERMKRYRERRHAKSSQTET